MCRLQCIVAAVVVLGAARVDGQPARTLAELEHVVAPGSRVQIADRNGDEVSGRLVRVGNGQLTATVRGETRTWQEAEITSVRQWRADSVKNGLAIGALAGLGMTALAVSVVCPAISGCSAREVTLGFLAYGGAGAGLGALGDALIPEHRVVFDANGQQDGSAVRVVPLTGRGRRGVALSLRF